MAKNRFFTQGLNAPLLASPVPLASATPVFMHIETLTAFVSVFFVEFRLPHFHDKVSPSLSDRSDFFAVLSDGGLTLFFDLVKIKWIETFGRTRKAYTERRNHSSTQQERKEVYGRTTRQSR